MLRETSEHIGLVMQDQDGTVRAIYESYTSAMEKAKAYTKMLGYSDIRIGGSPAQMNVGGVFKEIYRNLYIVRPLLRIGTWGPKMNVVYVHISPVAILSPEIDPLPFLRAWIGQDVGLELDEETEITTVALTKPNRDWILIDSINT